MGNGAVIELRSPLFMRIFMEDVNPSVPPVMALKPACLPGLRVFPLETLSGTFCHCGPQYPHPVPHRQRLELLPKDTLKNPDIQ